MLTMPLIREMCSSSQKPLGLVQPLQCFPVTALWSSPAFLSSNGRGLTFPFSVFPLSLSDAGQRPKFTFPGLPCRFSLSEVPDPPYNCSSTSKARCPFSLFLFSMSLPRAAAKICSFFALLFFSQSLIKLPLGFLLSLF